MFTMSSALDIWLFSAFIIENFLGKSYSRAHNILNISWFFKFCLTSKIYKISIYSLLNSSIKTSIWEHFFNIYYSCSLKKFDMVIDLVFISSKCIFMLFSNVFSSLLYTNNEMYVIKSLNCYSFFIKLILSMF